MEIEDTCIKTIFNYLFVLFKVSKMVINYERKFVDIKVLFNG